MASRASRSTSNRQTRAPSIPRLDRGAGLLLAAVIFAAGVVGSACASDSPLTCSEAALALAELVGRATATQAACGEAADCVIDDLSVACDGGAVLGLCPVAVRAEDVVRVRGSVDAEARAICSDVEPSCRSSAQCQAVERVDCVASRCVLVPRTTQ